MKKHCILSYPKCVQWRCWSDCANAQSDHNLHLAHMFEGTFSDIAAHTNFRTFPSETLLSVDTFNKKAHNGSVNGLLRPGSVCADFRLTCFFVVPTWWSYWYRLLIAQGKWKVFIINWVMLVALSFIGFLPYITTAPIYWSARTLQARISLHIFCVLISVLSARWHILHYPAILWVDNESPTRLRECLLYPRSQKKIIFQCCMWYIKILPTVLPYKLSS